MPADPCSYSFFRQGCFPFYLYLLIITGEDFLCLLPVRLRCQKTHHRNYDQTCNHRCSPCIDRRCNELDKHIGNRNSNACCKACPYCQLRGSFPKQAVQKRCQKCPRQCAPGNPHKLSDKGRRIKRQYNRNCNKEYDQHPHNEQLFLLAQVLHQISLDEIQCQRGAGGQYKRGKRGHRCGKHQNHHDSDQNVRKSRKHCRNDRVIGHASVCIVNPGLSNRRPKPPRK